jgi:hypothetical protein
MAVTEKTTSNILGGFFPAPKQPGTPAAGGFIIEEPNDTFIVAGLGYKVEFVPKTGETAFIEFDFIDEGRYVNNKWVRGRRINGDEARSGVELGMIPEVKRCSMYRYK